MKSTLILASIFVFALTTLSCKTNKQNTSSAAESSESAKEQKYRLIISFASKGSGAGSTERDAITNYITSHPKKPAFKNVMWGREGESDYCLTLKELSKKDQVDFVNQVKKLSGSNTLIFITENSICQHKGR